MVSTVVIQIPGTILQGSELTCCFLGFSRSRYGVITLTACLRSGRRIVSSTEGSTGWVSAQYCHT
jgi:hypothetical protein